MTSKLIDAAVVLALILGVAYVSDRPKPAPIPAPVVVPLPPIVIPKIPDFPRRPGSIGPVAPDGTEPQVDFPEWEWMQNVGSEIDGYGMCVFTSFEMMCRWAGLEEFRGFRDWCAKHYPGGGYPSKLAKLVKAYCVEKGVREFDPDKHLIQYEGTSVELLEDALRNGNLPCVTLYYSPRYGKRTIYHMVNCAHLDSKSGAILDNNFKPLEWASRVETIRKMKQRGEIWIVAIAIPGPPPLPRNM